MGVSYAMLASSLWPLVALIIPEYQLGTAYGMQVLDRKYVVFNFKYFFFIILDVSQFKILV